jgi:hypothetical protein
MEPRIHPPAGAKLYETEIATFWMGPEGILYSISKPPRRTVANITANMAMVREISPNRKPPLLVYLCPSPVPDRETRKLVTRHLPELYSAMAMIADSRLAKLIMNILFSVNKPPIPMKTFSDPEKAKGWLSLYC